MTRLEIIPFMQAAALLGYTTAKGFMMWCKRNHLTIYTNIKGKALNIFEFKWAVNSPMIAAFQHTYGDQWKEKYILFLDNDNLGALHLENRNVAPVAHLSNDYIPKSDNGKSFLNKISSYGKPKS